MASNKTRNATIRLPKTMPKILTLSDGRKISPTLLARELLFDFLAKSQGQKTEKA